MKARRRRGESGVVLVEFALLMPFLAILVFATIDIGRVYTLQHRLANASREGAAYAQYFPGKVAPAGSLCPNPDNIRSHALGEDGGVAANFTVTVAKLTVLGDTITETPITGCALTGIDPGTRVKVTVSKQFSTLTPIANQFVHSPAWIRQSTEVVVQG
jgi:hypothetical protein